MAIVTGAGRARGIGRAAALELARQGAHLVVCDLARPQPETDVRGRPSVATDMTELESAVNEIEQLGRRALAVPVDVTKAEDVETCVQAAIATFGGVDILVNNAGTPLGADTFANLADAAWEHSWQVNVMGIVRFARAVFPEMSKRKRGAIVVTASLLGLRVMQDTVAYTTTKFAAVGLSKALGLEFGAYGIRVNAVCPGDIDTQMEDLALEMEAEAEGVTPAAIAERYAKTTALARRGTGADVARVIAWLASDAAGFVNGTTVVVDGGLPLPAL